MKKELTVRMFCCVCLLLLQSSLKGYAFEIPEEVAREKARTTARSGWGLRDDAFVNTYRREDLEDDLSDFAHHPEARPVLIYQVSEEGIEFVGPHTRRIHTILHGTSKGYVAIARDPGQAYRLWGFKDSRTEFNRLMTDVSAAVSTESDALSLFYFYRKLVDGAERAPIYTSLDVRQAVESNFYRAYGERRWQGKFEKWWARFCKEALGISLQPDVTTSGSGYIVRIKAIEGFQLTTSSSESPRGEPRLKELAFEVSRAGEVRLLETRSIFPKEKGMPPER